MSIECKWLPKLILPPDNVWDRDEYIKYENKLYDIYINEIFNKIGYYEGKVVSMKRLPLTAERHESFYHIICGTYSDGTIKGLDIDRASRILWGKAMIQNEPCQYDNSSCSCNGLLVWNKKYKGKNRRIILFKEKRYIVVLENREDYWLYITSYYIENNHKLQSLTKEYRETAKNALHS